MKKVFGAVAGLVFALFGFGVIGLVMSLTYGGLQRIFPNNFANQMWGLVIFDVAVIAWAFAFAFQSNSLGQYAAAGAGFLVGFAGTGMMIYSEVTLSAQQLTGGNTDTAQIGQWMIYAFIIGSLVHVALLWMHHAADPDLAQQISTGVAQGLIRDRARAAVEHQLEAEAEILSRSLTRIEVERARRNLHVPGAQTVIDVPALPVDDSLYVPSNGYPIPRPTQEQSPSILKDPIGWVKRKFGKNGQHKYEQAVDQAVDVKQIAQTSDALMAWDTINGRRYRWWCKVCRDEAKPWLWAPTCQHVEQAKGEIEISIEQAEATMEQFISEGGDDEVGSDGYRESLSEKYDHLRPPHGDRQHPDLLLARIPQHAWTTIMWEWQIHDAKRRTEEKPRSSHNEPSYHPKPLGPTPIIQEDADQPKAPFQSE